MITAKNEVCMGRQWQIQIIFGQTSSYFKLTKMPPWLVPSMVDFWNNHMHCKINDRYFNIFFVEIQLKKEN